MTHIHTHNHTNVLVYLNFHKKVMASRKWLTDIAGIKYLEPEPPAACAATSPIRSGVNGKPTNLEGLSKQNASITKSEQTNSNADRAIDLPNVRSCPK